jgi:phenylacetate-CoA ligase
MTNGTRAEPARHWLLNHVILPAGDLVLRQSMIGRLRQLEHAQWWDSERVALERDRLVAAVVATAYRDVPLYRELMDTAGIKPAHIRSAADLVRLPIVTKAMLRAGFPDRTCRDTGRRTYDASTSGSTGANFRVREDGPTAAWYRASFLLSLEWAGWQPGDRHLQTGMNLRRSLQHRMKDALLSCHYVSAFDLSDAHLDESLAVIERHGIQYVMGYPGSLYYLARRAAKTGWNRPLRSAVTWGDNLTSIWRREIESAFRTRVFDTYGCGEGFQVAAQCGAGDTYHIHSLDVAVDVVDAAGHPVPRGRSGDLIITRLYAGPMPLIRYQVGDAGALGAFEPCVCGRGFDRLAGIDGRSADVVVTPDGNRLIVHFFTGILEYFPEIESFQVVQESAEELHLRVVPAGGFTAESERRIEAALREKGTGGMRIVIERVPEIPLTPGGKRHFIINRLA